MSEQILDLDLDFFLDRIAYHRSKKSGRLDDSEFTPWTEPEVRLFLEEQCLLSTTAPTRGSVVKHHDSVFWTWKKLIRKRKITIPFEIVHVDAHADLGMGDAGYVYIMTELLHMPVAERVSPKRKGITGITAGNFLAFAVACRWVSRITFVTHPRWSTMELPWTLFKDSDTGTGLLQLKKCTKPELDRFMNYSDAKALIDVEPEVPFETVPCSEFRSDRAFTFFFLSHSPTFTPSAADSLIPTIKEYMRGI